MIQVNATSAPRQKRHGLKSWIEAAKKRLHHNVLAIARQQRCRSFSSGEGHSLPAIWA
jgi:hypothetical protein